MTDLKKTLMERDNMTSEEADRAISECMEDFYERLEAGDYPYDILMEYFGLEPDYFDSILF